MQWAYIWAVLRARRVLEFVVVALQAFRFDIKLLLKFGGTVSDAGLALAGAKQGCPLSAAIFVCVMDPFLRMLSDGASARACTRAFADDLASVLTDMRVQLPCFARKFDIFHSVSGLMLGLAFQADCRCCVWHCHTVAKGSMLHCCHCNFCRRCHQGH